MNEKDYEFQDPTGTWQTGRIYPPKRHSSLVAMLLILVILLSGISTALGIMNMKLYWKLSTQETTPQVAFSRADGIPAATEPDSHPEATALEAGLGITGTMIPAVYQRYYKLPKGLYVTKVASGSQAGENGLVVGDIITHLDTWEVRDEESLALYADSIRSGDPVDLKLYRNGSEYTMTLYWGN